MFLVGIPLLLIPLVLYNMIAFLTPGLSWSQEIVRMRLPSQQDVAITLGDALVAFAVIVLFVEVFKATRIARRGLMDHLLAVLLFGGMAAEFALVREAATPTFLMLVVIAFVEVLTGFTVTRRVKRVVSRPSPAPAPAEDAAP